MKNFSDVKKEYGLILKWINGGGDDAGNVWYDTFWLENIHDDEKEKYYISEMNGAKINEKAYDFICQKTINGFRNEIHISCQDGVSSLYDNYIQLFEIMNIGKLYTLSDVLKEKGISVNRLSKNIQIPRKTLNDVAANNTLFKNTSVDKALKISKALDMTVEELYNKLYFERIK